MFWGQSEVGLRIFLWILVIKNKILSTDTPEERYFSPFQMLLASRWTRLVFCDVGFVKEATEIKKNALKVLNWQDENNVTKWDCEGRTGTYKYEQTLNW
jgi:hypothetical protein